jgi:hypothetical protein
MKKLTFLFFSILFFACGYNDSTCTYGDNEYWWDSTVDRCRAPNGQFAESSNCRTLSECPHPSVTITSPANNAVVSTTDRFEVQVDNFDIVDYTTYLDPSRGEGHIKVYIREPGEEAPGTYIRPGLQESTFTLETLFARDLGTEHIPSGTHIIRVELHNNDHSRYDGAIGHEIMIDIVK